MTNRELRFTREARANLASDGVARDHHRHGPAVVDHRPEVFVALDCSVLGCTVGERQRPFRKGAY
jgi:hypothetical protein